MLLTVRIIQIRAGVRGGKPIEKAVDEAVQRCIDERILADFLRRHRAEVKDMILAEYDEDLHIRNEKQISREEGEKKGWEDGRKEEKKRFVKSLLQRGGFSDEELASLAQLPLEKILEIKKECVL